ncbi:MAG: hypothetical protein IMZ46_06715 [Acidobacteria bacterium]|nr:hypothetical protein [Acidobacteriota bacterium]
MSRKTATYLALLASLHFTVGCAAKRVYGPGEGVAQLPPVLVEAKALPEVRIEAGGNPGFAGKIIGLENRTVRVLPAPYWNVETLRIDLAEITSIVLPGKKRSVGRAAAYGLGIGFLVAGGIAAAASKYDEDYQAALILAPAGGATVGLVAMVVSALSRSGNEISYDLSSMSDEEKAAAILKLMGVKR